MPVVVTPEVFFDLFILCLSYQWNPETLNTAYTTVDKAARILFGLGIITKKQRRLLSKDRRVQSLFVRRSRIVFPGITEIVVDESLDLPPQKLLDLLEKIVIQAPSYSLTASINRERMLRDYRIYLTYRGKAHAKDVQPRYQSIITKEKYFAEIERQALPNDVAKIAVIQKYKKRIVGVGSEEDA